MAKFDVDFTEAKEFTMCGKGEQDFKIVNSELKGYVKDGETRQKIELTCEVITGEHSGAKVYYSLFLKNTTGMFMFLNRIGVKVEKQTYNNLDTNMFIGKTFTAMVEHEIYNKTDGSVGSKPVIIDITIRKYNSVSNNVPDELDVSKNNPFEEFGDEITISDDFLE